MKEIRTQDAVGHIIPHDITRIVPGKGKDVAFRKGHIVREEDIEPLLKIGKVHLYVWENDGSMLHENDAAEILADLVAGPGMTRGEVKEGKIEIFASVPGVLRVDKARLDALNMIDEIMAATRHDYVPVTAGDKLAGTRIIPLAVEKSKIEEAKARVSGGTVLRIHPYVHRKAAIVTTGSEVFEGLIDDGFTPIVREKLSAYDVEEVGHITVPDNPEMTTNAILRVADKGADVILVTGGMSVDPDDRTPLAIRNAGARVVSYGAPVLPGAMFLVAYLNGAAVLGLPGCVMHSKKTIFDIILPRVMADIPITKEDINALAAGGLCLNCEHCIFPACGFGSL
ncbi:MAG: molybdopterin-binding protein [Clostridiales Family XIII bacterium]|nr:molybdopterin-binding protein [Clostridiales Family XIII bacterium]